MIGDETMTRINCVPVEELTRKHLVAEYRELPRIFALVRARVLSGGDSSNIVGMPEKYKLGSGHVTFFYNKLGWLGDRYMQLCDDMRRRGYTVNYGELSELTYGIPEDWFGWFDVTDDALAINRERIAERLASKG